MRDPVIRLAGDQAVLVEFERRVDPGISYKIRALGEWMNCHAEKGIKEYVPGYCTLLVEYNPVLISYSELQSLIFEGIRNISQSSSRHSRKVWIPVCYGGEYGPDLEDVARHNKLSPDEVVRIHSEPAYFIHFTGFLPGFPFLGGMSKRIATPRLPTPRPYVPGGSVGIAGEQTGVYPIDSPGGWRLIGRVPVKLYDRRRPDPFVFQEGDYLKFFPITPDEYQEIQESDAVEPYRFRIEDLGTIDQFEREGP